MSKDIPRFQVIKGGNRPRAGRVRLVDLETGQSETWEPYRCGPCSDDLGFAFGQLHEVRTGAVITAARGSAGTILGGETWLACPRCHRLVVQLTQAVPANQAQDQSGDVIVLETSSAAELDSEGGDQCP